MRSWLVWCLRDKLADYHDVTDDVITRRQSSSVRSSSRRRAAGSGSTTSCRSSSRRAAGTRQLVRQQAVHERSSPRIGVVDCSTSSTAAAGSLSTGRVVLRCHSADTEASERRYVGNDSSLDGSHSGGGDDSASVTERLKVGGASCSGQSSFESYGSTG